MPIELIDKIKQKNNGKFPLVEAQDVEVSKDKRLPDVLNEKLSINELNTVINVALAQAKESGAFDGEKGEDGKDGADGISVTHSWNGTTLTITSASGTSSANLKGERGAQGEKGEQGEKGADGAKGEDGYTPQKGKDYFTDTDKEEFVEDIKDKLSASDILYDGSSLNENITDVETALTFSLTKTRTISDTNNIIPLSTKITNIILNNSDNTTLSFSYSGQNECTIVVYNKSGNSITLPTSFIIGNYTTVLVNKITSVTLLDKSSCEINIMFTNGDCRILTIV